MSHNLQSMHEYKHEPPPSDDEDVPEDIPAPSNPPLCWTWREAAGATSPCELRDELIPRGWGVPTRGWGVPPPDDNPNDAYLGWGRLPPPANVNVGWGNVGWFRPPANVNAGWGRLPPPSNVNVVPAKNVNVQAPPPHLTIS
jgi:hypothetical protein